MFDRYDASSNTKTQNQSLDAFALFLRENPDQKGYLLSYGANQRANAYKQRLVRLGNIKRDRIEIITGPRCQKWHVELFYWHVLPAGKPSVSDCR